MTLFDEHMNIVLQGDPALEVKEINRQKMAAHIIGFNHPTILLNDHRPGTVTSVQQYFASGDPSNFHHAFRSVARVVFNDHEPDEWVINIYPPTTTAPTDLYLWIAAEIGAFIPAYEYHYFHSVPRGDKFSLLAVFSQPTLCEEFLPDLTVDYARM